MQRGFRLGQTHAGLFTYRRWLEAEFKTKTKRNCTIRVTKTKSLISCAVTSRLSGVFDFASNIKFSHNAAQITSADHVSLTSVLFGCMHMQLPKAVQSILKRYVRSSKRVQYCIV